MDRVVPIVPGDVRESLDVVLAEIEFRNSSGSKLTGYEVNGDETEVTLSFSEAIPPPSDDHEEPVIKLIPIVPGDVRESLDVVSAEMEFRNSGGSKLTGYEVNGDETEVTLTFE